MLTCLWLLPGPRRVGGVTFDVHTMLFGAVSVLVGVQIGLFGLFARFFAAFSGLLPSNALLERLGRKLTLEVGLAVSGITLLAGLALASRAVLAWSATGFGPLSVESTMRLTIPAGLLLVLGVQGIFASFLLSLLAIARR
jgi:hypothetical protein